MSTLEQLFASKEKIHLLRFFLFHSEQEFTVTELSRRVGRRYFKSKRQLKELMNLGALLEGTEEGSGEATYQIDSNWLLFQEFRALFIKAQLLVERDLVRRLQKSGRVRLLILAGLFVGDRGADTDILIVGTVNHRTVQRYLRMFERDLNQEVNYTIFSTAEYRYRKNLGDRFLYQILENRHLVVIDTIDKIRSRARRSVKTKKAYASRTKKKKKVIKRKSFKR